MREHIRPHVRFSVFQRDNFRCRYCGNGAPEVILHLDHIKPVAAGGTNELSNLRTSCDRCNLGKAAHVMPNDPIAQRAREKEIKFWAVDEFMSVIYFHARRIGQIITETCGWDHLDPVEQTILRACVQEYGEELVESEVRAQLDYLEDSLPEFHQLLHELPQICYERMERDIRDELEP